MVALQRRRVTMGIYAGMDVSDKATHPCVVDAEAGGGQAARTGTANPSGKSLSGPSKIFSFPSCSMRTNPIRIAQR